MQNLRQDDPSQKASSVMSGLFAKKVHIFKIEGAQNIRDWKKRSVIVHLSHYTKV